MVDNWVDFCDLYAVGLGCGFVVGLMALYVRRVKLFTISAFRQALRI